MQEAPAALRAALESDRLKPRDDDTAADANAIASLLARARGHHDAGRLREAETLYREILTVEPQQADALHLLGMIAYQVGRGGAALELIDRALRARPNEPEFHHDRGVVLQAQGRLDEALASYRATLAHAPRHADAHYNAGTVLQRLGRLDEAAASYRSALGSAPDLAEAHNNLGTVLKEQGRVGDAIACFTRAIELQPRVGDFHFNHGSALQALGRLEPAMDAYRTAVALDHVAACNELGNLLAGANRLDEAAQCYVVALRRRPDFVEAHNNLGNVLLDLGAVDAALAAYRRALALSDTPAIQANVARALRHPHVDLDGPDIRDLVTRALQEAWARPADLAAVAARVLMRDARTSALLARVADGNAVREEDLRALAHDPLLRAMLANAPVRDLALEKLLVGVRAALLARAESASAEDGDPAAAFTVALAQQCFINEYIWPETDGEADRVNRLGARMRAALHDARTGIPARWMAAVASYRPLTAWVESQPAARGAPDAMSALIAQQIQEPAEEARLRRTLPRLTPIEDAVSRRVQAQYEEHPYPRWVTVPATRPAPLELLLRQRFPRAPLRPLSGGLGPDILVAGCGTGQEAIETAEGNPWARVLAVDLSAASLAYARRKSDARGVPNVEYAQGDILQLTSLDRRFDVISSVGVLHHLADPRAGWRALHTVLRPGGVMQIGLYSERARTDIAQARSAITERGYPPTTPGIRRARQDLAADPRFATLAALRDFHATSECRDLLFHVHEQAVTLPWIAAALEELRLTLLGFVLEPAVVRRFVQRFPDDPGATHLSNWAVFESEHPETFRAMYVMWLQKAPD